jgi:hypothetical protein
MSQSTRAVILKSVPVRKCKAAFEDSARLDLYRIRMSTSNFVQLASLVNIP